MLEETLTALPDLRTYLANLPARAELIRRLHEKKAVKTKYGVPILAMDADRRRHYEV